MTTSQFEAVLRRIQGVIDRCNDALLYLAALCCLILVAATTGQVLARYFASVNSVAVQELQWHLFGFIFLFAAASTLRSNEHVRVDIFYGKANPGHRRLVDTIGTVFFLFPMAFVLVNEGISYVIQARSYGGTSDVGLFSFILAGESSPDPGGLPARWIIKAAIPLAGFSLALQGVGILIDHLLAWRADRRSAD